MAKSNLELLVTEVLSAAPTLETDRVESACARLIDGLRRSGTPLAVGKAKEVLGCLRGQRYFVLMQRLADTLIRFGCDEPVVYRQYAQALIDTGQLVPALETLAVLLRRTRKYPDEHSEALGLIGRTYKQIYVEADGSRLGAGHKALRKAIEAYQTGFNLDCPRSIWHGINLVALLCRARRDGLSIGANEDFEAIAQEIIATVEATPEPSAWFHATAAEAAIALGDWDAAERWTKKYVEARDADAFAVAGTLRQLMEVWGLELDDSRPGQLVAVLHAELLRRSGGRLELMPKQLQRLTAAHEHAFERILGDTGTQTFIWLKNGLQRADAVAMIRQGDGRGVGTGFLVRGGDLNPSWGDERLLLTNAHVVSDDPADQALPGETAFATFEARDAATGRRREHRVSSIVWHSSRSRLDASLLRLEPPVDLPACPIAKNLPAVGSDENQRVYIIGHPEGRELAFSLQDNRLLDHEGPPRGKPLLRERVLLHYRAPTEPGSSGSPVFEQSNWNIIGLHHAGGQFMRRLNGEAGTYPANEAIWIQSVVSGALGAHRETKRSVGKPSTYLSP
jgi:hypothetical protein